MDPFLGETRLFPWNFAPRGWALCSGQLLPINQNAALFSLLGVQYGGNGSTTFALPDLRGRTPVHFSSGLPQGSVGGAENVTLTIQTMPSHNHRLMASTAPANRRPVDGGTFADDQVDDVDYMAPFNATGSSFVALNPASIGTSGSGQAHPNVQPYLTLNYCIATSGIFPSRN